MMRDSRWIFRKIDTVKFERELTQSKAVLKMTNLTLKELFLFTQMYEKYKWGTVENKTVQFQLDMKI